MNSKLILLSFSLLLIVITPVFAQSVNDVVILETAQGDIIIEFFPDKAPNTVQNFVNLAHDGFYDGTAFHRIIPGFMIQGGDILSNSEENRDRWGTGSPGYFIDAEFNDIKHNKGIVSMARANDPNSAGSQFFIVHRDSNFLDGQYTVFGRIITQESFDTLEKIAALETNPRDQPVDWSQAKVLSAQVVPHSEISDATELGQPELTTPLIPPSDSSPEMPSNDYINKQFGFSMTFPQGWIVQEPGRSDPAFPVVAALSPETSSPVPPNMYMIVKDSGDKTLDDWIDERKESLQGFMDEGKIEIVSEKRDNLDGKESYVMIGKDKNDASGEVVNIQFKQIVIPYSGKFFEIYYVNSEEVYEDDLPKFEATLDTFRLDENLISSEAQPSEVQPTGEEGGCLIATATYGSELSTQVQLLRETRDSKLMQTESGQAFMSEFNKFYYTFSPTIADWERESPIFKEAVKITITPLLTSLSILNHVEVNSEGEMLGYGIGIILLNLGMYFAVPAVVIYKIKNRLD